MGHRVPRWVALAALGLAMWFGPKAFALGAGVGFVAVLVLQEMRQWRDS